MSFSERSGQEETKPVQRQSMDKDLRTAIWNVMLSRLFGKLSANPQGRVTQDYHVFIALWKAFFKEPMDDYERNLGERREWYRDTIFHMEWNRVYDLVEFVAAKMVPADLATFTRELNEALEQENAGYRLVGVRIVPVPPAGGSLGAQAVLEGIEKCRRASLGEIENRLKAMGESLAQSDDTNTENPLSTCCALFSDLFVALDQGATTGFASLSLAEKAKTVFERCEIPAHAQSIFQTLFAKQQANAPAPTTKSEDAFLVFSAAALLGLIVDCAVAKGVVDFAPTAGGKSNMWGEEF